MPDDQTDRLCGPPTTEDLEPLERFSIFDLPGTDTEDIPKLGKLHLPSKLREQYRTPTEVPVPGEHHEAAGDKPLTDFNVFDNGTGET